MNLREILKEVLSVDMDQLNKDTVLQDLEQWDSMAFMYLITSLEENFEIELDNDQVVKMQTLGDLLEILESKGISNHAM